MQTLQRCFQLRSYRELADRQGLLQEKSKSRSELFRFFKYKLCFFFLFFFLPFVLNLHPLCCPQETTTGRRPTIQTTVTASLTKYSPGACNQTSPVRFASKFCGECQKLCNKKSHLSFFFSLLIDGALHHQLQPSLYYIYPFIHHLPISPVTLSLPRRCPDRCGHHLSSQSG